MSKRHDLSGVVFLAVLTTLAACSSQGGARNEATRSGDSVASALAKIDEHDLLRHIAELSSDRYEGRAPGTNGEELTVAYLTQQFKALGLAPGNPDGTYVQKVPLAGFRAKPTASLTTPKGVTELAFPSDYVALTRRSVPE